MNYLTITWVSSHFVKISLWIVVELFKKNHHQEMSGSIYIVNDKLFEIGQSIFRSKIQAIYPATLCPIPVLTIFKHVLVDIYWALIVESRLEINTCLQ